MKIVTIVGARPQFVKAATISRAIKDIHSGSLEEVCIHTGQHYDANMSSVFFEDLNIPAPKYNLGISTNRHGSMTGRMLEAIEDVLLQENPNWLLIYGDTNSTLAGALAAAKLNIPIAHVEAGLRSFNNNMPEEINRIISDRISSLLLCPTDTAVNNLKSEGIFNGVHNVGDVMYDAALHMKIRAEKKSDILKKINISKNNYILLTCHRAENTDCKDNLYLILKEISKIAREIPVVFPMHPRTKKVIDSYGYNDLLAEVVVIDPVGYIDMIKLESNAAMIITDSGGVQKEAYFFKVPCVTLREQTEWVETLSSGWNKLVPPSTGRICEDVLSSLGKIPGEYCNFYGNGSAAYSVLNKIINY